MTSISWNGLNSAVSTNPWERSSVVVFATATVGAGACADTCASFLFVPLQELFNSSGRQAAAIRYKRFRMDNLLQLLFLGPQPEPEPFKSIGQSAHIERPKRV